MLSVFVEISPYGVFLHRQQGRGSLTGRGGSTGLSRAGTLVLRICLSVAFSLCLPFSFLLTVQVFLVGLLRLDPGQGCRLLRALFMPQ